MPLFFLIPLFTGLATGYLSKKCTDEIGYLTGLFTILSLILSLVLAPWQLQFLLLILVLISTNRLLQQNERKQYLHDRNQSLNSNDHKQSLTNTQSSEDEMNCKYRGACYQAMDTVGEVNQVEIIGKYRGGLWKIHQIVRASQTPSNAESTALRL